MYKTINESINFTTIEEFEQTCKNKALNYSVHAPISVVSKSYEKGDYYWCQVLLIDSTSVVRKYIFCWDMILHDWSYAWNVFALTINA